MGKSHKTQLILLLFAIVEYCYFAPNTQFYSLCMCVYQFFTVVNADEFTVWPSLLDVSHANN